MAASALGGGGTPTPLTELLLQLVTAGCIVAMLYGPARMTGNPPPPRIAWIATGLIVMVPLLQLVPLPPAVWHSMPGREVQLEALGVVGAQDTWRSWSLFPGRTMASLLAVVPATTAMLMMSRLSLQDFRWPIAAILLMVLLSMVLGAAQIAAGNDTALRFYSQSNPGFLNGFQANRNAQADILLIGMVAVTTTIGLRGRALRTSHAAVALAALAVLALGVVLTGSRAGIALIPVALIFCALVWHGFHKRIVLLLAGLVPVAILLTRLLQNNNAIQRVTNRFDAQGDFRSELWTDAVFAIGAYWPFGAGVGSAAPILSAVERLEIVDTSIPNRVHNDYLEFLLEAGVLGGLTIIALAAVVTCAAMRQFRNADGEMRRILCFPVAIIAIIGLHSVVDYPLRSMSLAVIVAAATGILLARPEKLLDQRVGGYVASPDTARAPEQFKGVHTT